MTKFIRDWNDLVGLESEHYKLEIDLDKCNGWIRPKVETEETDRDYCKHNVYLSTHTFYGKCYKEYTEILQRFGFDVELNNWDADKNY